MRVAVIYDVHGNLPALEAVLDAVRTAKVDHLVVGGDVMPGPLPREALAALRDLDVPTHFIYGNGEREVLARLAGGENRALPESVREVIAWVARQLDATDAQWVESWPATLRLDVPGLGQVLFCHGTPRSDTEVFTRLTPESPLMPVFAALDVSLVVCGHTHMQHDRVIGGVRVVNAGSVGMPFGQPGAYWLLLGPDVQLQHTMYDLAAAAARVRSTDYPEAEVFAGRDILHPRSEDEALAMLTKVELR